jgi:type VI secretion system protein ImpH
VDTTSGQSNPSVIAALRATPERFEFVQALRLLERAAKAQCDSPLGSAAVGFNHDPRNEFVRLRAAMDLAFPAAEIDSLRDDGARPELGVTFLGLNGVSGVLPAHYSQLVLRAHRSRNTALRDFLDMFNHRALSFFARALQKYRLPLAYERASDREPDAISGALFALIGMREPALRQRQAIADDVLVFYSGHFAHRPRTANALAGLLTDHFGVPIEIAQFQGRWLHLPLCEQTRLGGNTENSGSYVQLGVTALVGSRTWDVQGSFRVRIGPLNYAEFQSFMPGRPQLAKLQALTRSYVGPTLRFDVQLTLQGIEVPRLALCADEKVGAKLGANAWLPTTRACADANDAIFLAETA